MTFPVGRLPTTSDLTGMFVRFKSVAFTHGGSDLDLTDPANGLSPCAFELYITTTGNLAAVLAGEATGTPTVQTYPVVAGQVLQGAFVLLKSTSTANCIARQ